MNYAAYKKQNKNLLVVICLTDNLKEAEKANKENGGIGVWSFEEERWVVNNNT